MLSPALSQPALLQPALSRPVPALVAGTAAPATYGALIAAARDAVEHAVALGIEPRRPDPDTGAREIAGYERFLRYAGNHLHTLMRLGEVRNDHVRRLVQRLNSLTETGPATAPAAGPGYRPDDGPGEGPGQGPGQELAGGRWLHAATLLGTAHDLLATHLTGVGVPRTPEGEDTLTGPEIVVSCVELAELILTAVEGSYQLLQTTARAQQHHTVKPVPTTTFTRLHASNRAASLYARAALWDLHHQLTSGPPTAANAGPDNGLGNGLGTGLGTQLGHLRAAVHLEPAAPPAFETTLAALRLLRHYTYAQAHGLTAASPASLRDLALLGARITDPDTALAAPGTPGTPGTPGAPGASGAFGAPDAPPEPQEPPEPATPLQRLQRAHLADQLTAAHQAWGAAGEELTRTVQGLTKAPAGYAATIRHLLDADLTPGLRRALGSALPRIGADAAATIEHLGQRAELVTLQRPSLATRHEWRPILPDHAEQIAARFTAAARASRHAFATLTALEAPTRQPEPGRPQQRVHVEPHLQVQR